MKTIAIINRKGGVGKTTTALCFAEGLQKENKNVLLIDLDQQHNSTKQYAAQIEGKTTVYDLLTDKAADIKDALQHTESGDIIAGDDLVNRAEAEMAGLTGRDFMLADAIAQIDNNYDYIIIDCAPTLGIVATNALIAADEVIVPMLCDGYCVESFDGLLDAIKLIKASPRLNPNIKIVGMLITMYHSNQRLVRAFDLDLPKYANTCGTKVFETKIRSCCKVREAQQKGVSLFDYAPTCTTAKDYETFVSEYLSTC